VIRCGVDTRVFSPPVARPADGPLQIVCIGTLHEVKGQTHLIEACRLLREAGLRFTCRLVGEGPDREALETRIAAAGLSRQVELVGARTRPEIATMLRDADVLVLPSVPTSRGQREGLPVVLMEAMSAGLPVVASGISGIPELVEDGVTGLLVPPGQPVAIAAAVERLGHDPTLRRRLGAAARERVLADFDVDRNAAALAARFARSRDEALAGTLVGGSRR
jgi:colanic acid/amylovoran biosynthesis glycosyltransferase